MTTFTPDTTNNLFHLATDLVNQTNHNIFLTGKAGTGKTTFLKFIRENSPKQMAVLAPTGVAAINAGGVTIHSFFQLPLSPFIPQPAGFSSNGLQQNNSHTLIRGLKYNHEKRKLLQQLELLIIDEISMVRADVLDAIDLILRHFRHRYQEKFGGVQMLFIGDMLQLPPVVPDHEWQLLSSYYEGPFFFYSQVLRQSPPLYISFEKIYRQTEEAFLNLLNQVRDNELDDDGMALLESRYDSQFQPSHSEGYIILTTHNNKASEINLKNLAAINEPLFNYEAEIKDEFPDRAYPAEVKLGLKTGAQVMFIRNDSAERGKRYFNGKIGTVSRLENGKIYVTCKDAEQKETEIEVEKETWENVRYKLDKTSGNLNSETLGSFVQFPLRLAWAITIHKSQGLTFDKAIIDAGQAFAPGQVYVALSRCTSLSGLVLKSWIKKNGLFTNPQILAFNQQKQAPDVLHTELEKGKLNYLQSVLVKTFDFSAINKSADELGDYIAENAKSFRTDPTAWTNQLKTGIKKLQQTGFTFHSEIKKLFDSAAHSILHDRVKAGAKYFIQEINSLQNYLRENPLVTDSWIYSKDVNNLLKFIFEQLARKQYLMEGFFSNLDADEYHNRNRNFKIPPFKINTYSIAHQASGPLDHPELYKRLKSLRDKICSRKDLPVYLVANSKTLEEMAHYLPQSLTDLKKITGFGEAKAHAYGQDFLDVILDYCIPKNLETLIHEKQSNKKRSIKDAPAGKKDTKAETYKLYKEGKSISEIAKARNLAISTIETHFAMLIGSGEIRINEIISEEKIDIIQEALKDWDRTSITPVKQKLGEDYGYGEIRMVLSHIDSSH